MDKPYRSYRKQRRGAAAVEFALIAPVFILLVFGMIEFGRMVMVQQVMTNAAREGARTAVLEGSTESEVKTIVEDFLAAATITVDSSAIDVTPDPAAAASGDPITVTVTILYDDVSWLPGAMFLGGKELTTSTVMRREG